MPIIDSRNPQPSSTSPVQSRLARLPEHAELGKSRSGQQVWVSPLYSGNLGVLPLYRKFGHAALHEVRRLRRDPTIKLARWLSCAPIVSCPWTIESPKQNAPPGAVEFFEDLLQPLRVQLLQQISYSLVDYGWNCYEKIFSLREDGLVTVKRFKHLLHDLTDILIDPANGDYVGLKNGYAVLDTDSSMLHSFEPEGTDWYGNSVLFDTRQLQEDYRRLEEAAARYDDKIAGTHILIKYPEGESEFEGGMLDNAVIAQRVGQLIQSSGVVAIPVQVKDWVSEKNTSDPGSWSIEFLTDGGAGVAAFVARQEYLDKLKVRAFGLPERTVLETEGGTRADAEQHTSFAIVNIDLRHQLIAQTIDRQAIDVLLRINWGPQSVGTVTIKPTPIADEAKPFLQQLYTAYLQGPNGILESQDIDWHAIREVLGVSSMDHGSDVADAESFVSTG